MTTDSVEYLDNSAYTVADRSELRHPSSLNLANLVWPLLWMLLLMRIYIIVCTQSPFKAFWSFTEHTSNCLRLAFII